MITVSCAEKKSSRETIYTIPCKPRIIRGTDRCIPLCDECVEVADDEDETRYVTIEGQVFDMVD